MAHLARPARVSNVDEAQPVGEPCGRYLGSRHLFARLMAGRELRLWCAVVRAVDLEACERHRVPLVRDVDEPQTGGRSGCDARLGPRARQSLFGTACIRSASAFLKLAAPGAAPL